MSLAKVAIFKKRRHWRVECSRPACHPWLRNLRFANHALAVSWAASHISDHNGLADAMLRAHAVSRLSGAR